VKRILNRVLIVMLFCSVFCTNIGLYASGLDTGSVSKIAAENFLGTHNHNKYDMTFRDAPLRDVLQFLSLIAGVNIVVPEGIEAVVNVTFKDIFISDALNAIIRSNKLEYTIEGKVIRVGRLAQFREAGEDLKTETFRLRYAQATDILDNVKALISSRGSAVADGRTNSLIVRDVVSNMGNIHRFIGDVDIKDPPGCRCGEVLRGLVYPDECPLFGRVCTPRSPVGPCMVTSEGACNIMLKYGKGYFEKPAQAGNKFF